MYPRVVPGAEYSEQAKEWRFPSGAKVIFGYAERDQDAHQYQGQEYQWIGIDELGHFRTPYVWEYLSSRLRSTNADIPCYMRATCNPGPKWIRERWGFSASGEASRKVIEVDGRTFTRRFIPSRIDDNAALADTGYKQRLMQLPAQERAALLEGRWDVVDVPGAIYGDQVKDARADGRIRGVPIQPESPVHTAWDLGVGDATAIWLWQRIGSEVHLVDYIEDSGEGLPYYIAQLKDKAAHGRFAYGDHWAPHDIAVREFSTGQSRIDTAREHGITFRTVEQAHLEDGIHAARMLFPRCYFDAERCAAGIEALTNYRRDYNARLSEYKATPVHDWASHGCFTGDTEVLTRSGTRRIMDLPETGWVLTPCGWKRYELPRVTRHAARLVEVAFAGGYTVRCTPDHLFLTASGWKSAESLPPNIAIRSTLTRSRSTLMVASIVRGRLTRICREAVKNCIGMFGVARSETSRAAATFTIATATCSTIGLITWSACPRASISLSRGTSASGRRTAGSAKAREIVPPPGTLRQPAACGIVGTPSAPSHGRSGNTNRNHARTAGRCLMRLCGRVALAASIVHRIARQPRFGSVGELRVTSVRHLDERADVWDITVPQVHCFSLANGAIVHNSDAFRYLALVADKAGAPVWVKQPKPKVAMV